MRSGGTMAVTAQSSVGMLRGLACIKLLQPIEQCCLVRIRGLAARSRGLCSGRSAREMYEHSLEPNPLFGCTS